MTRRALLAMLAMAASDPERLLWTPGRKLISIPPPPRPRPAFKLGDVVSYRAQCFVVMRDANSIFDLRLCETWSHPDLLNVARPLRFFWRHPGSDQWIYDQLPPSIEIVPPLESPWGLVADRADRPDRYRSMIHRAPPLPAQESLRRKKPLASRADPA